MSVKDPTSVTEPASVTVRTPGPTWVFIRTEARLVLRDRATLAFTVALPVLLLVTFGVIPGVREPDPHLGGQPVIELIAAIGIAVSLAVLGIQLLPTSLVAYRERGVLRRLAATPVPPSTLLAARLVVSAATVAVASVLVIAVGRLGFGLPLPRQPAGFLAALVLAIAALLAVGLLIAAVARTTGAAAGIAAIVFYPSMFLAGVYVPRETLPHALQRVSDVTPLGAALQSIRDTWYGTAPRPLHLVTMAAWAAAASVAAARFFRWE